ncbi:MAG: methyltransferase domain-containing protein [Arenicella sp.]
MREDVQEYYGQHLNSSQDLQTNACTTAGSPPDYLKAILSHIHDEVLAKYYGCGLVVPDVLEGANILDLGSGSGRDCFAMSALVGESGSVVGVDMTDEQLEVSQKYVDYHREKFGYEHANTRFLKGYLEELDVLGFETNSFDIIVSNCVLNLCMDKAAVLRHAFSLLKPGGEMYFSDVYADRRIPEELTHDPVLYGECLSGALYWNDFINLAKRAGFADPRLVEDSPLAISNPHIEETVGNVRFYSATYRLFKIDDLEPACEDYGQAVKYKGSIDNSPHDFVLDKHHRIETGRIFPVCGNTFSMLKDTRFSKHFEFFGDKKQHLGVFEGCGLAVPFDQQGDVEQPSAGSGCC